MKLSFEAQFISCAEAVDGEIFQVTLDTLPSTFDEVERRSPYILISRNFAFTDPATVEWHDGSDYSGGGEIVELILRRERLSMTLDRGLEFDVVFRVTERKLAKLKSYLVKMLGERLTCQCRTG
jgi:hypothetical protein